MVSQRWYGNILHFGFAGGEHVGISVEVRLEKGETYSPALGLFGQFELILQLGQLLP